eukprot:8570531-Pyramimonas_sp.AAC.1
MPAAFRIMVARGNECSQLKRASDNDSAIAKAKAKAKAMAKHESNPCKDPAAAEPKHATCQEAGAAAQLCTKCLPCKDGSKGCRVCMGGWFVVQRKGGFLVRSAKDLSCAGKV